MFEVFVRELGSTGIEVQTGRFREMMIVALENDGPVTFSFFIYAVSCVLKTRIPRRFAAT